MHFPIRIIAIKHFISSQIIGTETCFTNFIPTKFIFLIGLILNGTSVMHDIQNDILFILCLKLHEQISST